MFWSSNKLFKKNLKNKLFNDVLNDNDENNFLLLCIFIYLFIYYYYYYYYFFFGGGELPGLENVKKH